MARSHATSKHTGYAYTNGVTRADEHNARVHVTRGHNQPISRALGTDDALARTHYHMGRVNAQMYWREMRPDYNAYVNWIYEHRAILLDGYTDAYQRGFWSFVDSIRTAQIARARRAGNWPPSHITVESWECIGEL